MLRLFLLVLYRLYYINFIMACKGVSSFKGLEEAREH